MAATAATAAGGGGGGGAAAGAGAAIGAAVAGGAVSRGLPAWVDNLRVRPPAPHRLKGFVSPPRPPVAAPDFGDAPVDPAAVRPPVTYTLTLAAAELALVVRALRAEPDDGRAALLAERFEAQARHRDDDSGVFGLRRGPGHTAWLG